jgi:hypothetical protein
VAAKVIKVRFKIEICILFVDINFHSEIFFRFY